MPTDNWLAAAKKENREAVVYVKVQDTSAAENTYGPAANTDGTWAGSVTLTNVSTTEIVDQAYPLSTGTTTATLTRVLSSSSAFFMRYNFSPETFDHFFEELVQSSVSYNIFEGSLVPPSSDTQTVTIRIRRTSHAGTLLYSSSGSRTVNSSYVSGSVETNDLIYKWTVSGTFTDTFSLDISGSEQVYIEIGFTGVGSDALQVQTSGLTATRSYEDLPQNGTNCNLTTSTIDMDLVPTTPVIFSVDDTIDADASIVYSAVGGNSDPPATSIGTIVDGDLLPAYQYYRITAQFNSTAGGRGILKEFILQEDLSKSFGTHLDYPFVGVHPVMLVDDLKTLSAKIDLQKGVSSTGQLDIVVNNTDFVSDFMATRYLRGADIQLFYGFAGLARLDFESVFTGTWQDYEINEDNTKVTIKVQDILKQFQGVKLPVVTYDASGAKSPANQDIVYTKQNIITTIKDIFDKIGIRDRYIPIEYDTLETSLSATDYNVTRTLYDDSPIDSKDILDQLGSSINLFMIPRGDGTLYPNLYDATTTPVDTIDIDNFRRGGIKGNYEEIKTRYYMFYNIASSTDPDPSNESDFNNAYALVNATTEAKWGDEIKPNSFFDKWRIGNNETNPLTTGLAAPPQALEDTADVLDSWFSDPKFTVDLKNMPPRWFGIQPADIVMIDNLKVPVTKAVWDSGTGYLVTDRIIYNGRMYESLQGTEISKNTNKNPATETAWWLDLNILSSGLTDGMKFITMKRTFNMKDGSVSFTFRQI